MGKNTWRSILTLAACLTVFSSIGAPQDRCSTFLLKNGQTLLVGHNLDERAHIPGLVFINKRGVAKTAVSWESLISGKSDATPPFSWTSRYASITFNPYGREFPDDGMNEAGLFIGEMSLVGSKFAVDPEKPRIFMCLWMQYILDTCQSVGQVIESASAFTIDGWGWHFFAADRNGHSASLEFLDGKLVIHSGDSMPVPVLCNTTYAQEVQDLDAQRKKIAQDPAFLEGKGIPRFAQAAVMIERFADSPKPAVDYAFHILEALERGGTQWSFVCDLKKMRAWFKTAGSAKIKQVGINDFRLGCNEPALWLDIHADLAGDVSGRFQTFSSEANRKLAEQALEAILKISPPFEKLVALRGGTMGGLLERFAAYPEKTRCEK